jgi:hypothetical protein
VEESVAGGWAQWPAGSSKTGDIVVGRVRLTIGDIELAARAVSVCDGHNRRHFDREERGAVLSRVEEFSDDDEVGIVERWEEGIC